MFAGSLAQGSSTPSSRTDDDWVLTDDDAAAAPDRKTPSIFLRPSEKTPAGQFKHAEALERAGRIRSTRRAYDALVHRWHASPEAFRAQLGVARMREKAGSRLRAFREYQYAVENFSGQFPYEFAVGRQFALANELRAELDKGFLGFGREAGVEEVVALYRKITRNAPAWERTPECYLMMGLTYESDKSFDEAVSPYEALAARFPAHELVPTAMLRAAYCRYRLSLQSPRDERTLRNALSALAAFRRDYPDHPEIAQATEWFAELRTDLVQLQFAQAVFYDRIRKNPRGAVVAYEEFLRNFHAWKEAAEQVAEARLRIEALKPLASSDPSVSALPTNPPPSEDAP